MNISAPTKGALLIPSCKICAHCSKPLIDMRASAKYCSDSCKQASYRGRTTPTTPKKKRKTQLEHLSGSFFGKYLVSNVKHSGTIQIIPSNSTVETFMELLELFKDRMYANGTGNHHLSYPDNFELCHLSPAKGKDGSRGLLIPANLVVAPASINRSLGNKSTAYSKNPNLSVPRSKLLPQWKVKAGDSDVKILKMINKYTNGALEHFQKMKKLKAYVSKETNFEGLKPLSRYMVHKLAIEYVSKHLDLAIPSDTSFEDLLTGHFETVPFHDIHIPFDTTFDDAANDDIDYYWFDYDKVSYYVGGVGYVGFAA